MAALDFLDRIPYLGCMRVAILSDIHANLQALTKALEIIDRLHIDEIYCLGDIVGYGANPNECIDLIRTRAKFCVLGNHDLAALDPSHARYFTKPGQISARWTHRVLTDANLSYLHALPYRVDLEHCTLVHASPSQPEAWEYVLSLGIAARQFSAFATPLCCIGHTHVPSICGEDLRTFTFKRGVRYLLNAGSVGQPRDGNPQLCFGVLDLTAWSYKTTRADYDVRAASKAITDAGLPSVLAIRLFFGQ